MSSLNLPSPKFISAFEVCSSRLGHTLKLTEDEVVVEYASCFACDKLVTGSPSYVCIISDDDHDCEDFYLHKRCAELLFLLDYHIHPLRFTKEEDIIREDATCYVCRSPILAGSLTYTCINDDDTDCQSFYLHKSCAELPSHINHHKHKQHSLSLLPQARARRCDVCYRYVKFTYICADCDFHVCVLCASEQRELRHPGHQEHTLTLMSRESLFTCDACFKEAKDSSYVCTTCEFWIHKGCALSPSTIPAPTYHHHPLNLIYSIPDMHRYFPRLCGICGYQARPNFWVYYCHKCTYFVHIKCSTSSVSMVNETEADGIDNEPDLVQLPLPSEESLFDLIITQYDKFQVDFQGEGENNTGILGIPNDSHVIEKHWSHPDHPLEQVYFTISENDDDDSDIDPIVLICDGCIQPITVSHPSYYACFECGFFLHSFCATKLPLKLPAGASPFHPQHLLLLQKGHTVFSLCGACFFPTNGFFYHCETCDIKLDIRCAFLPTRVKHIAHKQHSLVQRPASGSMCSATSIPIVGGVVYGCESCSNFQIGIHCAFMPSMIKHRYDTDHPITLRLPPFFYEGVFYCEICEEQVNNQWALYHCHESDHSFHHLCLQMLNNMKLGGTVKLLINNQSHTFTLVSKAPLRKGFLYKCQKCKDASVRGYIFECYGCGHLLCYRCMLGQIYL